LSTRVPLEVSNEAVRYILVIYERLADSYILLKYSIGAYQ